MGEGSQTIVNDSVLGSPVHMRIRPFGIGMKRNAAGGQCQPERGDHIRVELAGSTLFGGWDVGVDFGAELPIEVEQFPAGNKAGAFKGLQVQIGKVKLWHANTYILPVN